MIPQLHLLNWGMGVESTAILVRWLLESQSRPFNDFHNLIVLAAQTGVIEASVSLGAIRAKPKPETA